MVKYSISRAIPPLQNLKSNLNNGFYDERRFCILEYNAINIATAASDTLTQCSINAEDECPNDFTVNSATSDNAPYKAAIEAAFDSSLSRINVVLTDKYFLDTNAMCTDTNFAYCSIYLSAYVIVSETSTVRTD